MVLSTFMTKLGSLIPLLVLIYQFHWNFFFFFGVLTAFLPSLCKENYTSTMQIIQRIIYLSSVMFYTCQLVLNCPIFLANERWVLAIEYISPFENTHSFFKLPSKLNGCFRERYSGRKERISICVFPHVKYVVYYCVHVKSLQLCLILCDSL